MKRLLEKQFVRYCIIGTIGSIIEIALFFIFTDILKIQYILSNVLSFIITIFFLYYFNTHYVFRSEKLESKRNRHKFYIFLFTRILGLIFDTAVLSLCISVIDLPNLISKIIACASSTIINYYIGKHLFINN